MLDLSLCEAHVDFKRNSLIEEFRIDSRSMENVLVICLSVNEIPRIVLYALGNIHLDFFHNGAIFPTVHHKRRSLPLIRPIDKDNFTDMVDKFSDILVNVVASHNGFADVNDVRQIFRHEVALSENFFYDCVQNLIYLSNLHNVSP